MSLETCRADSPSNNQSDAATDRQTNSLKCRINTPETIPEEEIERIRRESLIPRVSLIGNSGRRKFSVVVDSVSTAINASTSVATNPADGSEASTDASSQSTMTSTIPPSSRSARKGSKIASRPHRKHIPDDNDGDFDEIFGRNSEVSNSNSRTGEAVSAMEHHTSQTMDQSLPMKDPTSGINSLSSSNNKVKGIRDSEDEEFDGLSFTASSMPDENDNDSNGIDPLAFLTEAQAKRVTFM